MSSPCPHLYIIDKSFSSKLLEEKENCCDWCSVTGPNQWLCLYKGCLKVGCGDGHQDHSSMHNNHFPAHCIIMNLNTKDAWCYMCEIEVTPWVISKLGEHLGGPINTSGVSLARPVTPPDSEDEDMADRDYDEECAINENMKPRGLVGLRNLGMTCYMNAALQALSNSVPLKQYMTDFPVALRNDRKQPGLSRIFQRLMMEMWHHSQPSYVTPSTLYHGFKQLYPSFRTYSQQDSQEFLRYFMDQIHEELREAVMLATDNSDSQGQVDKDDDEDDVDDEKDISVDFSEVDDSVSEEDKERSSSGLSELEDNRSDEEDYETCDSGVSNTSKVSMNNKPKKKRRHIQDVSGWPNSRGEQEGSEFSDAVSEANLLQSGSVAPKSPNLSSTTSGLGSSKPSMSSLSCSYRPGSEASIPNVGGKTTGLSSSLKRKKTVRYHSIISDVFDGTLVSSVQCLTCNTVSSRKETFQDLSLPIPSLEQLSLLQHSSSQQQSLHHHHHHHLHSQPQLNNQTSSSLHLAKTSCDAATDGWMWWIWSWLRSWFWGPTVSLHHCLAAFFSADELKGDNMYSCEKCGKLRNGIKYSKMVQLPEVLIIHLKRFRHEYMFSSKIGQYVSFPLHGLDLTPFLHKDCVSDIRSYDLYSVICHHGSVGGGHYTCYSQNWDNCRWYEFDDQCVTEVSPETVAGCEAYVLFYKKSSSDMVARRQRTIELMQVSSREPSLMQFYISKQWINKFNTFSEPGPIDNSDFLCPHGGVQPQKASYVSDLVVLFSQGVWEYLHESFGGGPACTQLYECVTCKEELEVLLNRQSLEFSTFVHLNQRFHAETHPTAIYAISMRWFRIWEAFARGRQQEYPPPIDNSSICSTKCGQPSLKCGSDFAPISEEIWQFFYTIYGGGPEISVRYGSSAGIVKRADQSDEGSCYLDNEPKETMSEENLMVNNSPSGHVSRQRTASASEVTRNSSSNSPCLRKNRRVNSICEGLTSTTSVTDNSQHDEGAAMNVVE